MSLKSISNPRKVSFMPGRHHTAQPHTKAARSKLTFIACHQHKVTNNRYLHAPSPPNSFESLKRTNGSRKIYSQLFLYYLHTTELFSNKCNKQSNLYVFKRINAVQIQNSTWQPSYWTVPIAITTTNQQVVPINIFPNKISNIWVIVTYITFYLQPE